LEAQRCSCGGAVPEGLSLRLTGTAGGGASVCPAGSKDVPNRLMLVQMAQ
jgi:hypothetical protein